MEEVNYSQWAHQLLEEIYYAPEEHRVSIIEEHLVKVHRRGARDGKDNGWKRDVDSDKKYWRSCRC